MRQMDRARQHSWIVKSLSIVALSALIGISAGVPALAGPPQPSAPLLDGTVQPNACLLPAPAAPQPKTCSFGANLIIIYYSDATHTHEVGECSEGPCPGAGCTGMKSSFGTAHRGEICEICN